MARNADIRLYLVTQFPYMSISTLQSLTTSMIKGIQKVKDDIDAFLPKEFSVNCTELYLGDPVTPTFSLRTETKFTTASGELEFTIASLELFNRELRGLILTRGLGMSKFSDVVFPNDDNLNYVLDHEGDVLSILNVEVFSCLTRRYQNSGRRGCDNPYYFEMEMPWALSPYKFTIDKITFGDKEVHYQISCDNSAVNKALSGPKVFKPVDTSIAPVENLPPLDQTFSRVYNLIRTGDRIMVRGDDNPNLAAALNVLVKKACTAIASGKKLGAVSIIAGTCKIDLGYKTIGSNTNCNINVWLDRNRPFHSFSGIDLNELVKGYNAQGELTRSGHYYDGYMAYFINNVNHGYSHDVIDWIYNLPLEQIFTPVVKRFESAHGEYFVQLTPIGEGYDIELTFGNHITGNWAPFRITKPLPNKELVTVDSDEPAQPEVKSFWKSLISKFF